MPDAAPSASSSAATTPGKNASGAPRKRRTATGTPGTDAAGVRPGGNGRKAVAVASAGAGRRSEKAGRANVYQVAELAGVSPGTVSCVLNNRGRVGEETRVRVLEVARSLGFRPQVQIRTRQVGVVADSIWHSLHDGSYYQSLWSHIALALCRHDMAMVVPENPVEHLQRRYLDGVIVVGEYPAFESMAARLGEHTPVVFTDDFSGRQDRWSVRSDCEATGRLAAEHFLKNGRRRLAFVGSPGSQEQVRLEGYRKAIVAAGATGVAGVECCEELFLMRSQEITFYSAVSRVIRLGADAILIPGSNYEALEGLNVIINVMGLRVPQDVALIGGEIHGVSEFLPPPMTTIEEPLTKIANLAVDTLAALMRGETPPRVSTLPVKLLARASA
ncbi:MAG: LacI family transcriptional regulator [Opitutaceae bacterium]|nr:LacI family transcriptional regulator [Opitutaceae bacterium]